MASPSRQSVWLCKSMVLHFLYLWCLVDIYTLFLGSVICILLYKECSQTAAALSQILWCKTNAFTQNFSGAICPLCGYEQGQADQTLPHWSCLSSRPAQDDSGSIPRVLSMCKYTNKEPRKLIMQVFDFYRNYVLIHLGFWHCWRLWPNDTRCRVFEDCGWDSFRTQVGGICDQSKFSSKFIEIKSWLQPPVSTTKIEKENKIVIVFKTKSNNSFAG